jgi:hypothetical protein
VIYLPSTGQPRYPRAARRASHNDSIKRRGRKQHARFARAVLRWYGRSPLLEQVLRRQADRVRGKASNAAWQARKAQIDEFLHQQ